MDDRAKVQGSKCYSDVLMGFGVQRVDDTGVQTSVRQSEDGHERMSISMLLIKLYGPGKRVSIDPVYQSTLTDHLTPA